MPTITEGWVVIAWKSSGESLHRFCPVEEDAWAWQASLHKLSSLDNLKSLHNIKTEMLPATLCTRNGDYLIFTSKYTIIGDEVFTNNEVE